MELTFQCCMEYVQVTAAYSNAVISAILPPISDFSKNLELPTPIPITVKHVARGFVSPYKGKVGGSVVLANGTVLGFNEGHVDAFFTTNSFFQEQDPNAIPRYYGTQRMTKVQAVEFARRKIQKAGYKLEDVLADLEPQVEQAEGIGTNTVPYFRINWLDPRSGTPRTTVEVNARDKSIEAMFFHHVVAIYQPGPVVDIQPGTIGPGQMGYSENKGSNVNPDYAKALVPVVLGSISNWVSRLNMDLPLPLTTNTIRRFYVSDQGGWPHIEVTLTNQWKFIYRNTNVTYVASPTRFFDSDQVAFRVKGYTGKRNLTEKEAFALARSTISKLGFPKDFVHMDSAPRIQKPIPLANCPEIPRIELEWTYPSAEQRDQWIRVEVNLDSGKVETVSFDDVSFWGKNPLPISMTTGPGK